jgi:hypothetical protein
MAPEWQVVKNVALVVKPSEHVFIAGRTGSGKTYLARKYLARYPQVVALDTKGTMTWPEVPAEDLTLVERLTDLTAAKTSKIIYRPGWQELEFDYYNEFFRWCYQRGHTLVWVDEAMSICPNPHKIPDYYKAILTRGRELKVAVWSLTQRPAGIPQVIMSEATHFFIFDLNMPQDRQKLTEVTGAQELLEKPSTGYGAYSFWYYNVEREAATPARLVERG